MVARKIVVVPSSQGSLGKNKGCENAGKAILDGMDVEYEVSEISDSDFGETTEMIAKLEGDVFVGGDHSITYGLFKNSGCDSLIIFDAHADCVNNFSPPTHEDFVRVLIEEGHVNAENVLIIGLRNVDKIEKKFLEEKGIKHVYWNDDVDILEEINDFIKNNNKIYLSVDIDALDGEKYVGTGYPEKGGFSLDEMLKLVGNVVGSKKVIRSDLVEVNPSIDKVDLTVEAGREILKLLVQ